MSTHLGLSFRLFPPLCSCSRCWAAGQASFPHSLFGLSCGRYWVACHVTCGSLLYSKFVFSLFVVDVFVSTMHIFGASLFVAAVQSLSGGVFRRHRHSTASQSPLLNSFTKPFSFNSSPTFTTNSQPASPFVSYRLARCYYSFFKPSLFHFSQPLIPAILRTSTLCPPQ